MKGCENMGCPDIYYERFVREADRLITYSWNTDKVTPLKEMEQKILGYKHNSDFYFNCGIAAAHVLDNVQEEGGDAFNAALGGLSEFESLIGNDDEDFCEVYDKQIAKPVEDKKVIKDLNGNPYTMEGTCPTCGAYLTMHGSYYCSWCGQYLDWGVEGTDVGDEEEENEIEGND